MSAEGQKYIEAAEYYTPASIENLQSALDAAALVTEDSAQSEIEEAAAAIENAISALEIVNQRLVLSGNTWSESDIALYAELTPPIAW